MYFLNRQYTHYPKNIEKTYALQLQRLHACGFAKQHLSINKFYHNSINFQGQEITPFLQYVVYSIKSRLSINLCRYYRISMKYMITGI